MAEISYVSPKTLEEALTVLARNPDTTAVLAGGTDLMVRVRDGKETPQTLLDISRLGLDKILVTDQGVSIGAMTDLTSIVEHPVLKEQFQVLSESAQEVGGLQTRNMGTIGGNVCTGLPSADVAIPLLVLGAEFILSGSEGERIVPADEFFLAPRKIDLRPDELLTEIRFALPPEEFGSAFIKFGKRKAMRLCIMNIGVALSLDSQFGAISSCRLAMGTAAPVPLRLTKTEAFLQGKQWNSETEAEAVTIMETEIKPRTSLRATKEYRQNLARVLLKRAVTLSIKRAGESGVKQDAN